MISLRTSAALLTALLVTCLTACAVSPPSIAVSAAANLESAFNELSAQFQNDTGTRVDLNYGATGTLAQQIIQGAPVDVFASADKSTVDDLARRGLVVPDSLRIYAHGQIVLYAGQNSPLRLNALEDLARPEIKRIAIANPERAPYGAAAKEALQKKGLWNSLQSKIIVAENIQQTKQYADSGNVDVAIIALSLATTSKGHWTAIPQDLYKPIEQALAIVRGARNEAGSRAFVDFLLGAKGRAVLSTYGYGLPSP